MTKKENKNIRTIKENPPASYFLSIILAIDDLPKDITPNNHKAILTEKLKNWLILRQKSYSLSLTPEKLCTALMLCEEISDNDIPSDDAIKQIEMKVCNKGLIEIHETLQSLLRDFCSRTKLELSLEKLIFKHPLILCKINSDDIIHCQESPVEILKRLISQSPLDLTQNDLYRLLTLCQYSDQHTRDGYLFPKTMLKLKQEPYFKEPKYFDLFQYMYYRLLSTKSRQAIESRLQDRNDKKIQNLLEYMLENFCDYAKMPVSVCKIKSVSNPSTFSLSKLFKGLSSLFCLSNKKDNHKSYHQKSSSILFRSLNRASHEAMPLFSPRSHAISPNETSLMAVKNIAPSVISSRAASIFCARPSCSKLTTAYKNLCKDRLV